MEALGFETVMTYRLRAVGGVRVAWFGGLNRRGWFLRLLSCSCAATRIQERQ